MINDGYLYRVQELVDNGYITTTEVYGIYYNNSILYPIINELDNWECHYDTCNTELTYEEKQITITYDIYSNTFKTYVLNNEGNIVVSMFTKSGWGYNLDVEETCNYYESSCPLGRDDVYDEHNHVAVSITNISGLRTYISEFLSNEFQEQ